MRCQKGGLGTGKIATSPDTTHRFCVDTTLRTKVGGFEPLTGTSFSSSSRNRARCCSRSPDKPFCWFGITMRWSPSALNMLRSLMGRCNKRWAWRRFPFHSNSPRMASVKCTLTSARLEFQGGSSGQPPGGFQGASCFAAQVALLRAISGAKASMARSANAVIVSSGFAPKDVGMTAPSST